MVPIIFYTRNVWKFSVLIADIIVAFDECTPYHAITDMRAINENDTPWLDQMAYPIWIML
jgi:queuine/archaeosine tRNA-ribosyltransferase